MADLLIARDMPLLDIEISRAGDGRTVTAYAATFDAEYGPLFDDPSVGEYHEVIDRVAFNRWIGRNGPDRVQVIYHHGFDGFGRPLDAPPMPIGRSLEIRPDANGLVTVTRYARTELADEVLQLIRDDAIRAYSFRGPVYRSAAPERRSGRIVVRRTELGLVEYGPTPYPANDAAKILAVRSSAAASAAPTIDELLEGLDDEQRAELARRLSTSGFPARPADDVGPDAAPDGTPPQAEVGQSHDVSAELIETRRRRIQLL